MEGCVGKAQRQPNGAESQLGKGMSSEIAEPFDVAEEIDADLARAAHRFATLGSEPKV
jgi:hypothetical protein